MKTACITLLAALVVSGARAEVQGDDSSQVCHSSAKVQSLEGELASARAELKQLRAQVEGGDVISVAAMAAQMGAVVGNVIEEKLKETDLDEQVYEKLQQTFGSVSAFSSTVVEQVTAMDYRVHLNTVSEKYAEHVAPHMASATKTAQPFVDEHVQPAFEKAKVQLAPHFATAQEFVSKHYKTIESDVMPSLKAKATQAYEQIPELSTLRFEPMLEKVTSPVFALIAKAAPKHANVLPSKPLDRLLLLGVAMIALYMSVRCAWVLLKVALKTTRLGAKIALVLTKIGLFFPVRVALRVLRFLLWISTGFYCCGLCRRKSASKKDAAAKDESNKKPAEKVKKVSLEEIVALLTEAQKKKKLDDAVKQACKLCKSGKAFSAPKNLEGKIVTADILKGALKKVGVDSKGLL